MNPKLIEKLHEQASGSYLQGDVDGALAAWRRVLEADPNDERALEGVQLCERMSGCESASVVTSGQSPFAVESDPSSSPVVDHGSSEETENALDELLDLGAPPAPLPPSTTASPEPPQANDQSDLLDFSDLREEADSTEEQGGFDVGELLSAPAGKAPAPKAPSPQQPAQETTWHFGVEPPSPEPAQPEPSVETPPADSEPASSAAGEEMSFGTRQTPSGEPVESASAGTDAAPTMDSEEVAAASLHRRVSDLLATALAEMERGEREQALTTLDRLLILDEENEAARSLKQKLMAEGESSGTVVKGEAEAEAVDRSEVEDDPGESPEMNLEAGAEDKAFPEASEATPEVEQVDSGLLSDAAADADSFFEEEPLFDDPSPEITEAAPRGRRFAIPALPGPKKIWIPTVAVIVLGLSFVLWNTLFGGGTSGDETETPGTQAEGPKGTESTTEPEPTPAEQPAIVDDGKSDEDRLAEALQRADAALVEADYAAAVVAFNQALKFDPENSDLLKRLESAGESYRIQQAKQERWKRALDEFDNGDYRAAMAFFYRLPEEEQTGKVGRYLRNGWYNLGVTALKNRECDEALNHFGEARRLDSGDSGVLEAADLAVRCTREGSAGVRASVTALRYRRIEDSP